MKLFSRKGHKGDEVRVGFEPDLVFDVGMNDGSDSLFYLRKGFRVVAVEANPQLAEASALRLQEYVDTGQLIIEQVGIAETEGKLRFYRNLDNDEWSSFDFKTGTRSGTRYEELDIACMPPRWLFEKHGMPYYLKVDIEMLDNIVIDALKGLPVRPKYASVECSHVDAFCCFKAAGATGYKLLVQNPDLMRQISLPDPPLEGKFVDHTFTARSSGPFGEEVPGEWKPLDFALHQFLTECRVPGEPRTRLWYDLHARFQVSKPS